MDMCDFIVWTKTSIIICRLRRDEPFLQETLPKAESFFMDHLLPELVCRSKDPDLAEEIKCLYCKKPSFGKMIKCTDCCQHFHYACVNITRWMQIDTSNDDEYWMLDNSMGGKTDEQR